MRRYEINPHADTQDCASVQALSVVQGDDQIRTGVTAQRIDCGAINPVSRRGVSWLIWLTVALLIAKVDQARPW